MSSTNGTVISLGLLLSVFGAEAVFGGAMAGAAPAPTPFVSAPVAATAVQVDADAVRGAPSRSPSETVPEGEPMPTALPPGQPRPIPDPLLQPAPSGARSGSVDVGAGLLDAVQQVFGGIDVGANPPDTVLDVGPDHVVQMTNSTFFQVWDKQGNDLSGGPISLGALWLPGDPCNSSLGDPIVVYDHLADRWLLSQFARNAARTRFWMCIAISMTPSPLPGDGFFLYTFEVPAFPDYPKFGVWPDAYFMTSYESPNLGVFAFERARMLDGDAARFVKNPNPVGTLSALSGANRDTRILPADLDGPPPPAGTPGFFLRSVDDLQDNANPTDRLEIYEFAIDWTTPAPTATFSLVDTIDGTSTPALAPFNTMACNRTGAEASPSFSPPGPTGSNPQPVRDCIPQPDSDDTIDALSNRPMMQLKFRAMSATDLRMVVNQTIDVSGSIPAMVGIVPALEVAGIRWYELQSNGANWSIRQQGTYAPQPPAATVEADLSHRWMGSMAMDRFGDVALGYSIVNDANDDGVIPTVPAPAVPEIYPGIRYASRLSSDPLGALPQPEEVIFDGTQPQSNQLASANPPIAGTNTDGIVIAQRWGDYSAMSVDPVDDCTFWYTTHVSAQEPAARTQIASFRVFEFDPIVCTLLGNCSFEEDLVHSQWVATKPNRKYALDAPQVNPRIVPLGQAVALRAPAGCNFVGVVNPNDDDVSGKLAHLAVAGSFPAGQTFRITVWASRGRVDGAADATFPRPKAASRLGIQFLGWGPGSVPTVDPATDDWSRRRSVRIRRAFSNWAPNGDWASQTFVFTPNRALSYFVITLAGVNRVHASYIAFDIESFEVL